MEPNLKSLFKQILELMKLRVVTNIEDIRSNEAEVKSILNKNQQFTNNYEINQKQRYSKNLLAENKDFLEIQLKIVKMIKVKLSLMKKEQNGNRFLCGLS